MYGYRLRKYSFLSFDIYIHTHKKLIDSVSKATLKSTGFSFANALEGQVRYSGPYLDYINIIKHKTVSGSYRRHHRKSQPLFGLKEHLETF